MTRTIATPVAHAVFNEFDRHGVLLGLIRLDLERNIGYKLRLLNVMVRRAGSTYRGLINGITRELGLDIVETMTIVPLKNNDIPLLTSPAVVFEDTRCILYSDFAEKTILQSIDRYEITGEAWTLQDLANVINATGYFVATLTSNALSQKRSMTIFNQSSVIEIPSEDISGAGSRIVLNNTNLIPGTVTVRSPNLIRLVATEVDIIRSGDYIVNHTEGLILALGAPAFGSFIKYSYRNDEFVAESSPVILYNLQSDDFKTKMFEQILDSDGVASNGLPTVLGADIINELLSVFPSSYGP